MVTDDIVTRLRHIAPIHEGRIWHECIAQAADEIERLRAALSIAAGKLSTLSPYTEWHPETIYKALLEDGAVKVRDGV